jgi:predicted phosphodiesterase
MAIMLLVIFVTGGQTFPNLQVHIALTGKANEYSIMCITNKRSLPKLILKYKFNSGSSYTHMKNNNQWRSFTYSSATAYSASVHEVIVQTEKNAKNMYFKIGLQYEEDPNFKYSKQFSFAIHDQTLVDEPFTFLTYGDMDTTEPAKQTMSHIYDLITEGKKKAETDNIHFIIHQGDIPYAWSEDKWDIWGKLIESIASSVPYMVAPGNHEENYDFTSYKSRFSNATSKNSGSPQGNLYYSFNYRSVHFIAISSEHDFDPESLQYKWLEADLKRVNRRETPFVITYSHRPQYSSNKNHGSALDFRQHMEPLMVKYKVDLALFGHVHAYERTCPIVKDGECGEAGVINLCVGTAGYDLNPYWEEMPNWSKYRETSHGVAKIKVNGRQSLTVTYLPNGEDRIGDEFTVYRRIEFSPEVQSRYHVPRIEE